MKGNSSLAYSLLASLSMSQRVSPMLVIDRTTGHNQRHGYRDNECSLPGFQHPPSSFPKHGASLPILLQTSLACRSDWLELLGLGPLTGLHPLRRRKSEFH